MRHYTLIAVAVAVLLFIGCATSAVMTSSHPESSSAGSIPDRAPDEDDLTIHLGFIGDICLDDYYTPMETLYANGSTDIKDGIDERFIEKMHSMDVMWANNEFCFTDRGEPLYGKMYTFSAPTANVSYLHDMGVDIVGLANNHVFDYGEEAFVDTLTTLRDAGIPYVGAGMNYAEASRPLYAVVGDIKVAYVAASCAEIDIFTLEAGEDSPGIMWCYDDEKFLEEIREARSNADYVIVLPHWGNEKTYILQDKQIYSSRAYIDAGADIVIGTHAHELQAIEYYNGKPILQNLGNFWFDGYDIDTVLLELAVSRENGVISTDVILHPGTQSGAFTSWSDEEERSRIFDYIGYISDWAVWIDAEGHVHPSE